MGIPRRGEEGRGGERRRGKKGGKRRAEKMGRRGK